MVIKKILFILYVFAEINNQSVDVLVFEWGRQPWAPKSQISFIYYNLETLLEKHYYFFLNPDKLEHFALWQIERSFTLTRFTQ